MKRLAIIVCASSLFAGSAQAMWEGNWLIGVTGGYAQQDGHYEVNIGYAPPGSQVGTVRKRFTEDEFIWGLLAGYQARCNSWLFGAEINVDWRDLDGFSRFAFTDPLRVGWNGQAEYHQDTVVGLTGRVGYELTPCLLPYIRLGAETSDDRLSASLINNVGTLSGAASDTRRQYRLVAGVGAEVPIPAICGLTFRLEYNYYSQGKVIGADSYFSDNSTVLLSSAKMRTNAGKASLVFNFM